MAGSGKGQVTVNGPSGPKATVEIKAFREEAVIPKKATESPNLTVFQIMSRVTMSLQEFLRIALPDG